MHTVMSVLVGLASYCSRGRGYHARRLSNLRGESGLPILGDTHRPLSGSTVLDEIGRYKGDSPCFLRFHRSSGRLGVASDLEKKLRYALGSTSWGLVAPAFSCPSEYSRPAVAADQSGDLNMSMQRSLWWLATCAAAVVLSATSASRVGALEPVTAVEGITEYRLENGLQVLLFPDPSSSTVTVNVTYLVGSRHEGRGEKGMAHLLEHMVFKGTEKTENIWGALEDHGAKFNGTTWTDRTNYFETLPASDENLEFAISMEADRMVNSRISEEDLAKEMTVVRNEFEMGENNPMRILYQRLLSTAYLWHNYGFSTIGNRSDIERVPASNLKKFYKEYYQPDNAMLVVAGKFDPEKALALIQTHFGAIPRPKRVLADTWTEEPVQDGARLVTLSRVGDVAAAGLAYHIPPGSHEDFPAVQVLQEALTSQPAGRLYRELVEPGELATVDGYTFAWAEPSVTVLFAQVPPDKDPDAALASMQALVEGVGETPVSEEDVERIKTRLLKDIKLAMTDSGQIGIELSEWAALGDWRLFFIHRDRLKAITAADVNRVAAHYLKASNRTAGVFYPTEKPERAEVPNAPDIASITEGYTGSETIQLGEAFDATPENIEARTERTTLGEGVKLALLSKKTRGESVQLHFRFHFGDEASLTPWVTACEFIPSMLLRGTAALSYQELQDQIDALQSKITFEGGPGLLEAHVETDRAHLEGILALLGSVFCVSLDLTQPSLMWRRRSRWRRWRRGCPTRARWRWWPCRGPRGPSPRTASTMCRRSRSGWIA